MPAPRPRAQRPDLTFPPPPPPDAHLTHDLTQLKVSRCTSSLALYLMDSFLAVHPENPKTRARLLAFSAVILASKMHDSNPLVHASFGEEFPPKALRRMELEILRHVDWEYMASPSPHDIATHLVSLAGLGRVKEAQLLHNAGVFLDVGFADNALLGEDPRHLALGALRVAHDAMHREGTPMAEVTHALEQRVGLAWPRAADACALRLRQLFEQAEARRRVVEAARAAARAARAAAACAATAAACAKAAEIAAAGAAHAALASTKGKTTPTSVARLVGFSAQLSPEDRRSRLRSHSVPALGGGGVGGGGAGGGRIGTTFSPPPPPNIVSLRSAAAGSPAGSVSEQQQKRPAPGRAAVPPPADEGFAQRKRMRVGAVVEEPAALTFRRGRGSRAGAGSSFGAHLG